MGLKDLLLPEKEIKVPGGGSFTIRGLNIRDITFLVRQHSGEIETLFAKFSNDADNIGEVGMSLLETAPDIAAEVIALAAGERDAVDVVKNLPFPVQVEALEGVAFLTFDAEGGPKKVIETVLRALRGVTGLLVDLKLPANGLSA